MYRWFLARKYLVRLITFLALLGVTYSVTVLIVVVSVMEGFRSELESRVRRTTSDIRVESGDFLGLEDPARVCELLEAIPGIEQASAAVETLALFRRVDSGSDTSDRLLIAFDLDDPASSAELDLYVGAFEADDVPTEWARLVQAFAEMPRTARELLSPEWAASLSRLLPRRLFGDAESREPALPVLVGSENWRARFLLPGSEIELTSFSPVDRSPRSRRFVVTGYFKTGLYELDSKGIVLSLGDANRFLDLTDEDGHLHVSSVRTRVEPEYEGEEEMAALRAEVEAVLEGHGFLFLETQTWREARNALLQAVQMEKFIVSVILGVVILFAGFMIFIILTVQVVERSRDIGVLASIGATARGIASSYFYIGFTLCVVGTVLGSAYGVVFALGVNPIQRWIKLLTGLEVFPEDVYYMDHIPVSFEPKDLLFIIIPTVGASLVASLVPALRVARKDPVVTLRYK